MWLAWDACDANARTAWKAQRTPSTRGPSTSHRRCRCPSSPRIARSQPPLWPMCPSTCGAPVAQLSWDAPHASIPRCRDTFRRHWETGQTRLGTPPNSWSCNRADRLVGRPRGASPTAGDRGRLWTCHGACQIGASLLPTLNVVQPGQRGLVPIRLTLV